MNYDKVVIQGKDYTLNNLHELPEDINCFKATSKSDDETVGFFGEANPLSSFHPAKFIHECQIYISSEQFIQATKAAYFSDLDTHMKIMGCKTSFDCKQISWSIKNVDSKRWDAIAMSLCEPGIREKFVQNPHLMDTLIRRTENKMIVECTKDRLWGTGTTLSEESCLNRAGGLLKVFLDVSLNASVMSTNPTSLCHHSRVQRHIPLVSWCHVQHHNHLLALNIQ